MTSEHANARLGDRQDMMRKIVVKHDRFNQAYGGIERFHRPVKDGVHDTGSLGVMIGDSRTGKTFAAKQYVKGFPQSVGAEGMIFPVVRADMPAEGGAAAILHAIAESLGLSVTSRMNNTAVFAAIKRALLRSATELVILDESEQFTKTDRTGVLTYVKDLLRKLVDIGTLNVLCIGLESTYDALSGDPRLVGRGLLPYTRLIPYEWKNSQDKMQFRALCNAFDERLPFNDRSHLGSLEMAARLHHVSEGNIGRLHDIIYFAGCAALNDGSDALEMAHFAEAYESRRPYGSPFNPFVHDLAAAPLAPAAAGRMDKVSASIFGKKRSAPDVFAKH